MTDSPASGESAASWPTGLTVAPLVVHTVGMTTTETAKSARTEKLTAEKMQALRDAYQDPSWRPGKGIGTTGASACTIARGWHTLTGHLTDDLHPCMSPAVRSWVIATQDRMPSEIRESAEWRDAAAGIWTAGATTREGEKARTEVVLDWLWGVLSDPAVVAAVPAQAREAWDRMVTTRRTPDDAADAAYAAYTAVYAALYAARATDADAADAAAHAARAARTVADAVADGDAAAAAYAAADAVRAASATSEVRAVWSRHNPARVLTALTR